MGYAEVKIGEIPKEGKNLYLFKYFSIYTKRNNKTNNTNNTPQTQKAQRFLETLTFLKHKSQR